MYKVTYDEHVCYASIEENNSWVEYIVIMPICSTVLRGYLYTVPKILFTYPALILALILSLILALYVW